MKLLYILYKNNKSFSVQSIWASTLFSPCVFLVKLFIYELEYASLSRALVESPSYPVEIGNLFVVCPKETEAANVKLVTYDSTSCHINSVVYVELMSHSCIEFVIYGDGHVTSHIQEYPM